MNKTKTFGLGTIEYRIPNVVESMRWLGKLGVSAGGATSERSEFEVMADLIEHLAPFVVSIDACKGETRIDTWADALCHIEFVAPLSEIAAELMGQFGATDAGKKRKKS
jgi:hypothetical protein